VCRRLHPWFLVELSNDSFQPSLQLDWFAMNIVQITPGAGAMFCGNCVRDNALVAALRRLGHEVLLLPLYLPLTLDEEDQSAGNPIFFSGINVYLEQKSPLFQQAPDWLHRMLASRTLLKWAGGKAAGTRAADLGEITLSMLQGEQGRQGRELDELVAWLKSQPKPDVICLSNALLVGMARRLRKELGVPVVCMLQGEDGFLDALPESHRDLCWQTAAERTSDVALFISPSNYFADKMSRRLGLAPERVRVVYNGINLQGYAPAGRNTAPVIGYFARMCRDKGLDILVDAYIELRKQDRFKNVRLHIGGSCGPADEPFVESLKDLLRKTGLLEAVEFRPNLTRSQKLEFLSSLSLFSVPARYGEAFGLYVIEAMAAGVPVVQPRAGAFTELVEMSGGGVLYDPETAGALPRIFVDLLSDPARSLVLSEAARKAAPELFSAEVMARSTIEALSTVAKSNPAAPSLTPQPVNG
jgi:glycosyltransferase involved in cell wall biosynthesis